MNPYQNLKTVVADVEGKIDNTVHTLLTERNALDDELLRLADMQEGHEREKAACEAVIAELQAELDDAVALDDKETRRKFDKLRKTQVDLDFHSTKLASIEKTIGKHHNRWDYLTSQIGGLFDGVVLNTRDAVEASLRQHLKELTATIHELRNNVNEKRACLSLSGSRNYGHGFSFRITDQLHELDRLRY